MSLEMICPRSSSCGAPRCGHRGPHMVNAHCHELLTDCRHGVCDCVDLSSVLDKTGGDDDGVR